MVVDAAGGIYGGAPNVAARVQALAEPGEVVVTARVQRQVARSVLDTLLSLDDHVRLAWQGLFSWTSGNGCGALASNGMKRYSAKTRYAPPIQFE